MKKWQKILIIPLTLLVLQLCTLVATAQERFWIVKNTTENQTLWAKMEKDCREVPSFIRIQQFNYDMVKTRSLTFSSKELPTDESNKLKIIELEKVLDKMRIIRKIKLFYFTGNGGDFIAGGLLDPQTWDTVIIVTPLFFETFTDQRLWIAVMAHELSHESMDYWRGRWVETHADLMDDLTRQEILLEKEARTDIGGAQLLRFLGEDPGLILEVLGQSLSFLKSDWDFRQFQERTRVVREYFKEIEQLHHIKTLGTERFLFTPQGLVVEFT